MPILYEVHTLKGGNWMIDSTYSDRDKDGRYGEAALCRETTSKV